jgi:hypothetical protein
VVKLESSNSNRNVADVIKRSNVRRRELTNKEQLRIRNKREREERQLNRVKDKECSNVTIERNSYKKSIEILNKYLEYRAEGLEVQDIVDRLGLIGVTKLRRYLRLAGYPEEKIQAELVMKQDNKLKGRYQVNLFSDSEMKKMNKERKEKIKEVLGDTYKVDEK